MLTRCNMAISAKKGKNRVIKNVLHYFLFVNIVSQLVPCRGSIELQSKAFMNGAEDELYNSGRPFQESLRYESPSFNSDIFFNPPFMDYGSRPIGMPFVQQIMVHNTNPHLSLHLLSISGSSPHFHCSFFEDKLVAPLGNTSFEICFLAQNLGQIRTTLYIHSSRGSFKYHVSGEGTHNPYRIRPVLGARVPINSSFSPVIHLYNPHESVLQVEEIYSSGSDLHLELPSGQIEATKDLWEIPPYETKPIMKANFLGRVENNHTAFIRIKTNKESREEMLVVPMEVEVTSNPGIFSKIEMLDFGILRIFDENASLKVKVINSRLQAIQITNVTVEPPNAAVEIDFVASEVKHDIYNPTEVALVTFHASKASSHKDCSGHVVIWSADPSQKLQIPYQAQVFFGDLEYTKNLYFYSADSSHNLSSNFSVKNSFQHPIVVFNVSLGSLAEGTFSIVNFSKPVFIEPGKELVLMTILFHPVRADLHFKSEVILHTNLSIFATSLIVFNGKLQVLYESNYLSERLNFGTLAIGERRSLNFTLLNDNPYDIVISMLYTNFEGASVEFLYTNHNNDQESEKTNSCSTHNLCVLRSHWEVVLRLTVQAPEMEGTFGSDVVVETESQHLLVKFILQTTTGNIVIDPTRLLFHHCFPGKIVQIDLHVNSSFQKELRLQDVTFLPNDSRFRFMPLNSHLTTISPNRESLVGRLSFDPLQECMLDCYSALPTDTSAGHSWLHGLSLNNSVVEIDILLYSRFRHKWNNMASSEKISNITMQLNTDHIKGFLFNLQAFFTWPTLLDRSTISFPHTQLGNQSIAWFTIENPSNLPLLLHIVPISVYPNVRQFLTSLGPHLLATEEFLELQNRPFSMYEGNVSFHTFTISSILDSDSMENLSSEPHVAGIKPSPNTSVILLQPGKRVSVKITFHPQEEKSYNSLFIIRNNLTINELMKVQGQGCLGDLRLSNRRPGSSKPLSFEMSDKYVKMCEKGFSKVVQPDFSIKRSFVLHNFGNLPISIYSFEISGRNCEGHGFKILDCAPMTLHANESKKLNIIFTPDFTMSKVRQYLVLNTCLSVRIEFILQANLPNYMISKCASVIPRPLWEPMMFYCIVVLMGFMAFCVITAAYYESNQILSNEFHHIRNEHLEGYYDKSKVFDLRLCTSNEPQRYLHKKVAMQENMNPITLDGKMAQSVLSTPNPNKSPVGQKASKSATNLVSFLSDFCQGLKLTFSSSHNNHKKLCTESKKKNESSKYLFSLLHFFKTKTLDKAQTSKKDLSPVQGRNNIILQRKSENDNILTLRKNKRQKNFMTNKSVDLTTETEAKAPLGNKIDAGSRSCRQYARKGLLSEIKLPDKNDDSSSTATDMSSLENDEKNILNDYQPVKKDRNKMSRIGNITSKTTSSTQDEHVEGVALHSPKRKLSKDFEENLKYRTQIKNEGNKSKPFGAIRGKRKSNAPGAFSEIKLRHHSKSPTPNWDSASLDGDDLNDIVNQTSNFAKLKSSSLCPEKQGKCLNPNQNKHPEPLSSLAATTKPIKTSLPVTAEATFSVSSLSTFGGRPVAAVGATIRRPWIQLPTPSTQNDIISPSKGSSTNTIQNLASSDSFLTSTHLLNSSSVSRPYFLTASDSKDLISNSYLDPINNLKPSLEKHDTMMQKLLAERRKRVLEYQKKMLISEWSGLGKNAATSQKQWNDYSGYWPSQTPISNGIGSIPSPVPRYDLFAASPWPNNNFTSQENTWMSPSIWRFNEPLKLGSQDSDSYAIFDPFNTLENNGSIWNPTSTGSSMNNGWDMSSSSSKPSSDGK